MGKTARDYQNEGIDWLAQTFRGILKCPAGGGKTFIATSAIDRVARGHQRAAKARITWLANTREQVEQAEEAFSFFPAINQLCRVRVACWQGGSDCSEEDLVVVDECHHAGAPTLGALVATAPRARWGLSATPFGGDPEKNLALMALFDHQMFEIDRARIVDGGHLTKARVHLHSDTDPGIAEIIEDALPKLLEERMKRFRHLDEVEQRQRITWQLCQTHGIVRNYVRNRRVISLASQNDAALVLVGTVDHGAMLAEEIEGAVVCHSKMGVKRRREAIAAFRDGSLRCMIATSLADEGLDVPRASTLILACAGRSAAKVEQRTGRVLRTFAGKEHGIIHDFVDRQHPMLHSQHKSRLRLYKKLGYEISQ
ncbi:MAG TPA: helicase-related protein [Chthoniobacteraceae bacterium]|nr:helicase-related protein [Chthoniobacteraceae bacterium]